MSRCFPFQPTGYTRIGSCSEALIESIKLRSEDKKSKKDHKKEKRREKNEKRKERKESTPHSIKAKEQKLIEPEKIRAEKSDLCLQKGYYCDNEQLERSDITEEHDRPVSWQEPCCSDSIQSGSKRKRSDSPSSHDRGTGIKLRFSFRKHREPEVYRVDDHVASTSRTVVTTPLSSAQDTNASHHELPCVANAERDQCSGNSDLQSFPHQGAASNTNLLDDGYQSLFKNWVPLPLTFDGYSSEDQDWLFSSKHQEESSVSKRVKPITTAPLRCSSPSMWPRAQYLPEVEVYALPYAVPF